MKVGLLDVDGHNFPNVPLMKISAFHKNNGCEVGFVDNYLEAYDIVYQSKVFSFSKDLEYYPNSKQLIYGGTGYDLRNKLPNEIENCFPDYELYGCKEAHGFLTRGCPRNCGFCVVGEKEGLCSHKVANLDRFWNGQKEIKLLDPNLLACKDKIELLHQLSDSKAWIDFTQGLDVRFIDEECASALNEIKVKMIHFAWDNMKDSDLVVNKLKEFKIYTKLGYRKLKVYVLTNYRTTIEEDLYRIYKLKDLGYDPYLMIYDKYEFVDKRTNKLKSLQELLKKFSLEQINHFKIVWKIQRWVNNKIIFRTCDRFEDYGKVS